ncbi:hypothetical protein XarbCFBP8150_21865, partial [Xanthomonas arboricola]
MKDFPHVLVLSAHSHTQRQVDHGADEGWQGARPLHEYNVGAVIDLSLGMAMCAEHQHMRKILQQG